MKKLKTCPNCGIDFEYFKKKGRLGCDTCYKVFRTELIPIIHNFHKNVKHVGKIPLSEGVEQSDRIRHISKLRLALKEAIDSEEYEKAAILRDDIKKMENKILSDENE